MGYEPWVIIRGEGTRASAALWRCGEVGREGALVFRYILGGLRDWEGTWGWERRVGGGACRLPCGPIPLGFDGPYEGYSDSWDSLILS